MKVFDYRITKIEKGSFFIEYKFSRFDSWHEVEKMFKTKPKAEAWISKNFNVGCK